MAPKRRGGRTGLPSSRISTFDSSPFTCDNSETLLIRTLSFPQRIRAFVPDNSPPRSTPLSLATWRTSELLVTRLWSAKDS